ncbi:hypothetical protein GCM10007147_45660 [Nocardiopsis kunsanensis]|uniref:ABC transporter domain-containing protein n=1 Tax=Nocardiopsis kunsanensis TaxID=141693 RepID=A0A919CMK4_9ACTN|nr:hypothetical protein GCM10007147_45660 [Nocardiopsis kunsanensis]
MGADYFEHVGVGFELPAGFGRLTVRENLAAFASLYRGPVEDPDALLERVDLTDAADRRADELSKGMRMRMNLARSLINRPELLFLDEPTSGQDPVRSALLRGLVRETAQTGCTVFLTTHDMVTADLLCDRLAFVTRGRIAAIDTPRGFNLGHGRPGLVAEIKGAGARELSMESLTDVDRQLSDRIEALIARRDTLQRLADGDRSLLPQRACAILDRLTDLGFRSDFVATQREGLVLARALAPEFFEGFVTQLEHRLDDPEYVELQKRGWDALSWDPDDPRLEEIASALADNLLADRVLMEAQADFFSTPDAITRYGLINNHRADQMPSMARLTELIEERLRAAGFDIPHH